MPSTAWSASRRSLAAPSPSYGGPRDRRVQAILAGLDQRIWHQVQPPIQTPPAVPQAAPVA